MGKCTRNPKTSAMDVSQSSIGVRTRARTLALRRLQSSSHDFLELRSRSLQKPPILRNSAKTVDEKQEIEIEIGERKEDEVECCERQTGGVEIGDSEIEASFGENSLDVEGRERSTRESTPCSLMRTSDLTPPGSSTKRRTPSMSNQGAHTSVTNIPTSQELEEFFARAEQPLQQRFIEKYNFDIVNDVPLPGRYEWVRVAPLAGKN